MKRKFINQLEGFEKYKGYSVTSDGRVYSHFKRHDKEWLIMDEPQKELKPSLNKKGYLRVRLSNVYGKKSASVHRLVAIAFIPNPENKPQVNHIDCNKMNNDVSNLEWVTNDENHHHKIDHGLNIVKSGVEHYTHTRQYQEGEHHGCKPVFQFDINDNFIAEYKSIKQAAEYTGIDRSSISKAAHGHIDTAGEYKWKLNYEGSTTNSCRSVDASASKWATLANLQDEDIV